MPLKLFTDTQKSALAKEAGIEATQDNFSRDMDPTTGEATMYMKLGNNQKFYGKNPMKVQAGDPVVQQALRMKDQNAAQRLYDAYNIANSTVPTSRAVIQNDINVRYNYQDQFEAITQQRQQLMKSMVGDQSQVFSATNPDGTPVDPRVKVAQYQANMKGIGDRLTQLDNLEQTYRSEAKVLGDAAYDQQVKENEKAKTALLYIKQIADQEKQDEDKELSRQKFEFQKSEFNQKIALDKQKESRISSKRTGGGGGGAKVGPEEKLQKEVDKYIGNLRVKVTDPTSGVDRDKAHNDAYQKYGREMAKYGYKDEEIKNYIHNALK